MIKEVTNYFFRILLQVCREFPNIYFDEVMNYLEKKKRNFFKLTDKFRSLHYLWKKGKK